MKKKYKQEDNVALRKIIEPLMASAIQDALGVKITYVVRSSSIMHTDLQPEGDTFTINVVIETHEKQETPDDVPANTE